MNWIKKNWMWITLVILAITVIIYWYNSKASDTSKKIYLTKRLREKAEDKEEIQNIDALKEALAMCEKQYANVKIGGGVHPCDGMRKTVEEMQKKLAA